MDKVNGFIPLAKQIQNHWLWTDKPFARGQAWIDLLLMANFEDRQIISKGVIVEVERGQVFRTIKFLAERWGWTPKKVRKFIEALEGQQMVTSKGLSNGTLITIENYTKWNDSGQTKCTTKGKQNAHQRASLGSQNNNNNKDNNINTINSISGTRVPHGTVRQKVIDEWNDLPLPNIRDIKNGTNRYSMLSARVKEYGIDSVIEAIRSIRDSNFLLGQNSKGWSITFDWFVRPNNFAKVLEGNYTDKLPNGEKSEFTMTDEEFNRIVQEHSGADTW